MQETDPKKVLPAQVIPVRDELGNFSFVEVLNSIQTEDSPDEFPIAKQNMPVSPLNVTPKRVIEDRPETEKDIKKATFKTSAQTVLEEFKLPSRPKYTDVQKPLPNSLIASKDRPKSTARFYIDSKDEQEAAMQKVPTGIVSQTEKIDAATKTFITTYATKIDQELHSRLSTIAVSYWKGIRNDKKTKEVLMRDRMLGGMGLSEPEALEMLAGMEQSNAVGTENTIPPAASQETEKTGEPEDTLSKPSMKEKPLITEVKARDRQQKRTESIQLPTLPLKPTAKAEPVGPVEELGLLAIEDFRHLSKDPEEAAQKVFQKIELLGDESLELKAEAIKRWKKSPIYSEYLAIGQHSMEGGKSIEEVINAKEVSQMNMKEFEAISDLNKSLQF